MYTVNDVGKHNTEKSCWIIINHKVYDLTDYLYNHPAGADVLISYGGKDCTTIFDYTAHTDKAKKDMERNLIGT